MKHTRLLEIIREEIAGALNEVEKNPPKIAQKPSIPAPKQKSLDAEERDTMKSRALGEDLLNEMAKITEPIRKGIEVAVNRMTKQKSDITPEEITSLIRNKKTQEKVAPELFAALEADEEEKGGDKKYTAGLGYPQTLGAVQIAMGLKKAKGSEPKTKKPTSTGKKGSPAGEPKTEKSATLTKGDDGFDTVEYSDDEGSAEAAKAAGSDETAKKLGKVAYSKNLTPEEEIQYKTALKSINAKVKRIEDGEEKPDDRALLKKTYQNSEIQRLFKAKGSNLNDILKGIIG
jgi:hypothetical protein